MKRVPTRVLLLLCAAVTLTATLSAQGVLTKRPNVFINSNCNGYLEYLPSGYASGTEKYPLFLFINGIGSTGDGSEAALENHFSGGGFPHEQQRAGTFPESFTVNGQTFRFVMITPQFVTPFWQRAPNSREINDVINFVVQQYRIDTTRIYLVGNSSGGGPVWDYTGESSQYANRLAAIIPFCGVAFPTQQKANVIKHAKVAVWAFHNEFDPGVPVSFTRDFVDMINKAPTPNPPAKATIFPDGGHGCWYLPMMRMYTENGLDMYQWLLTNKRTHTTVNAGNDFEIALPVNSVQLRGSGTGPNGTAVAYSWQKIFGPAGGNIGTASSLVTNITDMTSGTYIFRLTITDNSGATSSDDVAVNVEPASLRIEAEAWSAMSGVQTEPTTDAGGGLTVGYIDNGDWMDYTFSVPAAGNYSVRFRTASFYSGGEFQVRKADGTVLKTVTVYSTASWNEYMNLVHTIPLAAGTQTIRILSTGANGFNFNWFEIIGGTGAAPPPPNQSPTAQAGADAGITLPVSSVQLNGSGSDPDGSITGYAWSQVAGPSTASFSNSSAAVTTASGLVQGSYTFRLTVTDNGGATATDDVVITVNPAPNVLPTANAGADQVITLPVNSVQLSGSGTDADGTITGYTWSQASGPAAATIGSSDAAATTVSGLVQGVYTFRLLVQDNRGGTAEDFVQVTVNPAPNVAPSANAGPDQSVTLPANTAQLNGSGTDPDGSITAYAWAQTSGPNTATIASPASAATGLSNLVQGVYSFRLTVTDNRGGTAFDDVVITVHAAPPPPNVSPSANAGADLEITLPASQVQLSGSGTDPDGSITAYAWTQVGGPSTAALGNSAAAATTASGLVQGVYTFRLTVTDNRGATASDDVAVTVHAAPPPPNQPPTAQAGSDQSITLPQNSVSLQGAGSDPDGSISTFSWMQTGGPSAAALSHPSAASTTASGLVQGTYIFRLTVTDNNGASAHDEVTITVNPAAVTPSGRIEAEHWTAMSGVQTEGTSDAGGGLNVGYIDNSDWMEYSVTAAAAGTHTLYFRVASFYSGAQFQVKKGDAVLATVDVPNTGGWQNWQTLSAVVNLAAGTQTIRLLSVHSSGWNINWIEVQQGGTPVNQLPVAAAGADQVITLPASSVQLTGSGMDSDGSITAYAWTQLSGPSTASIATPASANTSVSGLVQGTYTFRLTVTDNSGGTATDDMVVTVQGASNPGSSKIEAEHWTAMSGVQTEGTSDAGGGLNVGWIDNGDWMEYTIHPATTGSFTMNFRVSTPDAGAQFQVRKQDGTVLATVNVPQTGGWQSWQTISATVSLQEGSQTIRLQSVNGTNWNINWLQFLGSITPPPPPPPSSRIEAEAWSAMSGVQTEGTSDAGGGLNVGWIEAGDWMEYTVTTTAAGNHTLHFRIATPQSGGRLEVRRTDGSVLATLDIPNTGGWQSWQTVSTVASLAAGMQTIRIVSMNNTNWNINWIEVEQGGSITQTTRIEAELYTAMSGIQAESTWDAGGGQNVGYIDLGDWMEYKVTVPQAGNYTMFFRVASQDAGGQFQVRNTGGGVLATLNVPQTLSWQSWKTIEATVALQAGTQTIRLVSTSTTGWNLNWIEVVLGTSRLVKPVESTLTQAVPVQLSVTPNPVTDGVMLELDGAYAGPVQVQLAGMHGGVARAFELQKEKGLQRFPLQLGTLRAGTYILQVTLKGQRLTQKLVKL